MTGSEGVTAGSGGGTSPGSVSLQRLRRGTAEVTATAERRAKTVDGSIVGRRVL